MKTTTSKSESGAGMLLVVLVAIVLVAVLAVGFGLTKPHDKPAKDVTLPPKPAFVKAHLGGDCSDEAKTYVGKTVIGSDGKYRFCLPNGFKTYASVNQEFGDVISVGYDGTVQTYQADVPATLEVLTGGKDISSVISFVFRPASARTANDDDLIPSAKVTKVSAAYGVNVTGTKFKVTDLPLGSPQSDTGGAPAGSINYLYRFENNKDLFVVGYLNQPNAPDQTALMDAVATTVSLN